MIQYNLEKYIMRKQRLGYYGENRSSDSYSRTCTIGDSYFLTQRHKKGISFWGGYTKYPRRKD